MNNKFDELTKNMAQSVTRRAALKKFGLGLAGIALASFGLASVVNAKGRPPWCAPTDLCCCRNCKTALPKTDPDYGGCEVQCGLPCANL